MDDCIFCKIVSGEIPSKTVYKDDDLIAIMDINPSCDGHILIIPVKHYKTIFDLPDDLLIKTKELAEKLIPIINKATGYNGASLIYNYGDRQEVKHVHLHIIPDFKQSPLKSVDEVYNLVMDLKNEENN